MVTEDYVSFETAKLLKEKGFDEECRAFYYKGILHETNRTYVFDKLSNTQLLKQYGDWEDVSKYVMAPTIQMARKWLGDEKHIYIIVDFGTYPSLNKTYWIPRIETIDKIYGLDDENLTREFNTREEAAEVAIKYCLENLI